RNEDEPQGSQESSLPGPQSAPGQSVILPSSWPLTVGHAPTLNCQGVGMPKLAGSCRYSFRIRKKKPRSGSSWYSPRSTPVTKSPSQVVSEGAMGGRAASPNQNA